MLLVMCYLFVNENKFKYMKKRRLKLKTGPTGLLNFSKF